MYTTLVGFKQHHWPELSWVDVQNMHYSSVQAAALQLLNVGSDIATIVSLFRASVTASFAYNSTLALNSIMKICLLFLDYPKVGTSFYFLLFWACFSLSLSLSLLTHTQKVTIAPPLLLSLSALNFAKRVLSQRRIFYGWHWKKRSRECFLWILPPTLILRNISGKYI